MRSARTAMYERPTWGPPPSMLRTDDQTARQPLPAPRRGVGGSDGVGLLEASGISAGYNGEAILRNVDLSVAPGEFVALLGPNGAGKTTTLMALAGILPLDAGEVRWDGRPWRPSLHRRARDGLGLVLERRGTFPSLTVKDHLSIAPGAPEAVLGLFPALEKLMRRKAGLLSGGEQRMLAIGLALAAQPRLMLIDELSLGLAPMVVDRIAQVLRNAASNGVGLLVVDQHVGRLLRIADRGYVLRRGRVEMTGTAEELSQRIAEIQDAYL
ncbi:MAG: ABC transporter ATP-binding protein [Actinomycetota bacterium]